MKIEDTLNLMSKSYLDRIVKSYTEDVYTLQTEDEYRDAIRNAQKFLANPDKIKERLDKYLKESKTPYQDRLIMDFILRTLLKSQEYKNTQEYIIEEIRAAERDIIKKSKQKENFKHLDDNSFEIFKTILEAGLEDEIISEDELHLIRKVKKKLSIQDKDQYLIQAHISYFPQKNNQIHSAAQIIQRLKDLQKCGIIFYLNRSSEQYLLIPTELIDGVKRFLGVELIDGKFMDLLDILTNSQLRQVLDNLKIKQQGNKDELISRILLTGINPSEVLDTLTKDRLAKICKKLPEVNISGSKDALINRIIKYFDDLINIDISKSKDEREVYFQYFIQLARKDMPNLIGKKIVKNENDANIAFEKATCYLFETKLNHKLLKQDGNEHCDGCLEMGKNGELFMWDNKTKMSGSYTFPNSHLRQFKRYIRDASRRGARVSCFLIIAPEIDESAHINAERLKYESGSDTDVSIISAENLKWLSEQWEKSSNGQKFNLHVFNTTGVLTKDKLKSKMRILKN